MPRVQGLQQVERFCSSYLSDEDAIRAVPQRGAEQVRDRHRGQRRLLSEGRLCSPSFEPQNVGFVQMDFRRFLDDDDAIGVWDVCCQRVQERGFASPRSA